MTSGAGRAPLDWVHQVVDQSVAAELASTLGISPVIAQLLVLRGLKGPEEAERFLHPTLSNLHDPFLLCDLPAAFERLQRALIQGERIAVHGDYDVDGVTSTVILTRILELLGGDVIHFIPNRLQDGYGLEPAAIEHLAAKDVNVVVSVDCGIRSYAAAIRASELGLDLIITDHHEPQQEIPPALAVINPKRVDCSYPDKDLAGVGVTLKVVQALCERTNHSAWLPSFIKLAALGTIADVVPLRGENRVIAKLGLEGLSQSRHTSGLRALLDSAGLLGEQLTSAHVAFRLAPRINAAGRMSTPDLATRLLLLTDDKREAEAKQLADSLETENTRRKQEEAEILLAARRKVEKDPAVGAHAILVVWGVGWHRGVIGIVAAKLVDLFHRPAIVFAVDGNVAHGSGRSVANFDLLHALERCGELFTRFGGHHHAAGMTMPTDNLKELRQRITEFADNCLSQNDLKPRLQIDCRLPLDGITPMVVEGLRAMEPFGAGNPRPMFHTGAAELADGPRVMKEKHLSMSVRQGGRLFRAVGWRMAERSAFIKENRRELDLAFNLAENTYRGERTVELSIADLRRGS